MNRAKQLGITLAVVVSVFLIFSQTVYASINVGTSSQAAYGYYIGPGTLTLISQVVIGLVIGGAAIIGVYRMRVKNFFTNFFTKKRHDKERGETEDSQNSK